MNTMTEALEATMARRARAQSLNAVKASLANAESRDAGSKARGRDGEPFVCATVGLRIDDLKSVVDQVDALRARVTALEENARPRCRGCAALLGDHHANAKPCAVGRGQVLPSEIPGFVESVAAEVLSRRKP